MTQQKHVAHVVGCSCERCTFLESTCPYCDWDEIYGQYICVLPYEWFWWCGIGDESSKVKYCGNCGKKLPDRGFNPCAKCEKHQPKPIWTASESDIRRATLDMPREDLKKHKTSASF